MKQIACLDFTIPASTPEEECAQIVERVNEFMQESERAGTLPNLTPFESWGSYNQKFIPHRVRCTVWFWYDPPLPEAKKMFIQDAASDAKVLRSLAQVIVAKGKPYEWIPQFLRELADRLEKE